MFPSPLTIHEVFLKKKERHVTLFSIFTVTSHYVADGVLEKGMSLCMYGTSYQLLCNLLTNTFRGQMTTPPHGRHGHGPHSNVILCTWQGVTEGTGGVFSQ